MVGKTIIKNDSFLIHVWWPRGFNFVSRFVVSTVHDSCEQLKSGSLRLHIDWSLPTAMTTLPLDEEAARSISGFHCNCRDPSQVRKRPLDCPLLTTNADRYLLQMPTALLSYIIVKVVIYLLFTRYLQRV